MNRAILFITIMFPIITFDIVIRSSPNVIKEALACNCPVISTDVGDVKDLTGMYIIVI